MQPAAGSLLATVYPLVCNKYELTEDGEKWQKILGH